ncbi:MAG: AAA family ATPase, partial [Oscillospiraceae bacterium]
QGRRVDFRNTVIIMTSNLGARLITEQNNALGFSAVTESQEKERDYNKIKDDVMGEVKKAFRPEFLNRIDDVIVFHQLGENEIKKIGVKMLNSLAKRLSDNEISVIFSDEAISQIAKVGFDPIYGARPLRRAIQSKIEDMVAEKMLEGTIKSGDSITVGYENEKFITTK